MRLLNTTSTSLKLETFYDVSVPPYAILSHRWEAEEVTFQDLTSKSVSFLAGYPKLMGCIKQAASEGWQWVWVDTCCIDKTSSAELSEAINSMFKWYKEAGVCYAYLNDVPPGLSLQDHTHGYSKFRRSKWFTRGWTLQELLAPATVVFYDSEWVEIGTKSCMSRLVSEITGIHYLEKYAGACIAQKMSWAAKRETTRLEDQAYCLMGIFGVHMPPLYGEGRNAFLRLQLEILKNNDDESIFAWRPMDDVDFPQTGLLTYSPISFAHSANVRRANFDPDRPPITMTNRGLRIEASLCPTRGSNCTAPYWLALNCTTSGGEAIALTVPLTQSNAGFGFSRMLLSQMHHLTGEEFERTFSTRRTIYVEQAPFSPANQTKGPTSFHFKCGNLHEHGFGRPGTVIIGLPHEGIRNAERIEDIEAIIGCSGLEKSFTFTTDGGTELEFIVTVLVDDDAPQMMLTIPRKGETWSTTWDSIFAGSKAARLDRVSKLLKSGKAISAALRKVGGPNRRVVVDLSIEPTGKLRWPLLDMDGNN